VFIRIVRDITGSIGDDEQQQQAKESQDDIEAGKKQQASQPQPKKKKKRQMEMNKSVAKCGCSNFLLIAMSIFFAVLTIAGIIVGGTLLSSTDTGASLGFAFGILFFIFFVVMTSMLCCACCRFPIDD
jgi:hypothetical protein